VGGRRSRLAATPATADLLRRVRFGDLELPRDLAAGGYRMLPGR
jgi:hypothetical protein